MKYLDSNVDDQVCGWAYSVHDVHNTSLHTYESDFSIYLDPGPLQNPILVLQQLINTSIDLAPGLVNLLSDRSRHALSARAHIFFQRPSSNKLLLLVLSDVSTLAMFPR